MNIVILHVRSQGDIGSIVLSVVNTLAEITNHVGNNLAPGTSGEVEINFVQLRQVCGLDRSLQVITE